MKLASIIGNKAKWLQLNEIDSFVKITYLRAGRNGSIYDQYLLFVYKQRIQIQQQQIAGFALTQLQRHRWEVSSLLPHSAANLASHQKCACTKSGEIMRLHCTKEFQRQSQQQVVNRMVHCLQQSKTKSAKSEQIPSNAEHLTLIKIALHSRQSNAAGYLMFAQNYIK